MLVRLACIAFLVWPACALARDVGSRVERDAAKLAERTKTEARAVVAAVLRDAEIEMTPCRFGMQWSTTPVPASIAQNYLGSSLDADVIASHLGVSPSALIDPDDGMRGSFCPENHADALWRQMLDDFRSGADPGKRDTYEGKPIGPLRLRLSRAEITVPVFNRAFTTAVVIAGYTSRHTWKSSADAVSQNPRLFDEAGYLRYTDIEGFGYTYVYRKQGGRWTQIDRSEDWTMN